MVVIGAGIARWLLLAQGLLDGCYWHSYGSWGIFSIKLKQMKMA